MNKLQDIVSDEELEKVWGSASFGIPKRDVIKLTLLKRASLYRCGHTCQVICKQLDLLDHESNLTFKGGQYLWEAFRNGSNF